MSNRWLLFSIALAAGVASALLLLPWDVFDPRDTGWLGDDSAQAYLGWAFYRHERALTLPLTWTDRLGYPVGVSVGLLDAIPLMAVPLRLFSDVLPEPFQYLGLYACLSLVLQACFGMLLCRALYPGDRVFTVGGGLFLALAPGLTLRLGMGHFALTSQWLILAALWAYWRPLSSPRWMGPFFLILAVAGACHPYLGLMCLLVSWSAVWRLNLDGRCSWRVGAMLAGALALTLVASLVTFGFVPSLTPSTYEGRGLGLYSLNLLAPVNSMGLSTFLPRLPLAWPEQYEGFSYLGAGIIGLLVASVARHPGQALSLTRRLIVSPSTRPLVVLAVVCTAAAVSPTVTLGPFTLADIELPRVLEVPASIFRASGRLFWPAYYLIVLAALGLAFRLWSPRLRHVVLVLALLIQIIDVRPVQTFAAANIRRSAPDLLRSTQWRDLGRDHRRLMVVPPWHCPDHVGDDRAFWIFPRLAASLGMQTNTYYAARISRGELRTHCDMIGAATMAGVLDPEAAYVVSDAVLDALRATDQQTHRCRTLDGFHLCTKVAAGADDEHDPRRYELGTVLDFRENGNVGPYVLFGWSTPEEGGTWTDGLAASLVMQIEPPSADSLEVVAAIPEVAGPWYRVRRVDVIINDQVAAHWWFIAGDGPRVRRAPVPPAALTGDGLLDIRFRIAHPDSPAALGLDSDTRLLGLLVRSMAVTRSGGNHPLVSEPR